MNNFLIALGLLVGCATIATGIECYVCVYTSGVVATGSDCSGPTPSASNVVNCTTSNCVHVVATASVLGVSQTTVTRTCGTTAATGCTTVAGAQSCTYSCTTDRCNSDNGSGSVKMSVVAMTLSMIVGILFTKF